MNFLTQVKGFTPVIDALAQETSLITAAVYGIVWRYCQMDNRVCEASVETIAQRVGVSYRTTLRHLKILVELEYLIDTTPGLRYKPHTYKDAGKAKIIGLVEARISEPETASPGEVGQRVIPHVTESHTSCDRESDDHVTESPIKRVHEESIQDSIEEGAADAAIPWENSNLSLAQRMFEALAHICAWDIGLITADQRGALNQTEKKLRGLRNQTIAPKDVIAFGKWWEDYDWRGQKGSHPRPSDVREEWGRFRYWQQHPEKRGKHNGNRQGSNSPAQPIPSFATGLGTPISDEFPDGWQPGDE